MWSRAEVLVQNFIHDMKNHIARQNQSLSSPSWNSVVCKGPDPIADEQSTAMPCIWPRNPGAPQFVRLWQMGEGLASAHGFTVFGKNQSRRRAGVTTSASIATDQRRLQARRRIFSSPARESAFSPQAVQLCGNRRKTNPTGSVQGCWPRCPCSSARRLDAQRIAPRKIAAKLTITSPAISVLLGGPFRSAPLSIPDLRSFPRPHSQTPGLGLK